MDNKNNTSITNLQDKSIDDSHKNGKSNSGSDLMKCQNTKTQNNNNRNNQNPNNSNQNKNRNKQSFNRPKFNNYNQSNQFGSMSGHQSNNNNNYQSNFEDKKPDRKFTGRCRLFVGNLPGDLTENEFKEMFTKYGDIGEVFLNSARSFGFIKLDTRLNAEHAKQEMDGSLFKGRNIRVRFASHGAAVRVKNLSPYVSNEYLEQAFSFFGPVERAVVIVDDKGKPTGEGIVEFERKPAAMQCLQKCSESCFLITSYPKPVIVEPFEQKDDEDGLPEKSIIKNPQFHQDRDCQPRFVVPESFEFKLAMKWKELHEQEKQFNEEVKKRVEQSKEMLEYEIEQTIMDHKTFLLKEDLRRRQEELERMEEMRKGELQRRQEMGMRSQNDFRQGDIFMGQNDMMINNRNRGFHQQNDDFSINQNSFGSNNSYMNYGYDQQNIIQNQDFRKPNELMNQSVDISMMSQNNYQQNQFNRNNKFKINRKIQNSNFNNDDNGYPGYDNKRPRY